eukprot:Nk52_evm5s2118 gene=Nk52_evmTU5s2118
MRLLTHNMLQCHVKGCTVNNFPLRVEGAVPGEKDEGYSNLTLKVEKIEADYNASFLKHMLPKLDWAALVKTCGELSGAMDTAVVLPGEMPEGIASFVVAPVNMDGGADEVEKEVETLHGQLSEEDKLVLRNLHLLLMETNVAQGRMVCNNCGHVYTIKDGIPNMLLCEDEV